jgi:hypothetical protein
MVKARSERKSLSRNRLLSISFEAEFVKLFGETKRFKRIYHTFAHLKIFGHEPSPGI